TRGVLTVKFLSPATPEHNAPPRARINRRRVPQRSPAPQIVAARPQRIAVAWPHNLLWPGYRKEARKPCGFRARMELESLPLLRQGLVLGLGGPDQGEQAQEEDGRQGQHRAAQLEARHEEPEGPGRRRGEEPGDVVAEPGAGGPQAGGVELG